MKAPLRPVWHKSRDRWLLSVPPKLSPTGKRQRLFFAREKDALAEGKRLAAVRRAYGQAGSVLPAESHVDATKALRILDGNGTLTEAARLWVATQTARKASVTVEQACERWKAANTKGWSARYSTEVRATTRRVCDAIGSRMVCDIKHGDMEPLLAKLWPTPTRHNAARKLIHALFAFALKHEWCADNPLAKVDPAKVAERPICVMDSAKAQGLMTAASTLPECLPVVSLMLFAGIRKAEAERLDWSDVMLDKGVVAVTGAKAKTASARYVESEPCLRAWLELVPQQKRTGRIRPNCWSRKWTAIRAAAGITDDQNVCRHSFASNWLAAFDDINGLRSRMGHAGNALIYKHYRVAVLKSDALKFWAIYPPGAEASATMRAV